jgi:hypothetical protein
MTYANPKSKTGSTFDKHSIMLYGICNPTQTQDVSIAIEHIARWHTKSQGENQLRLGVTEHNAIEHARGKKVN